MNKKRLNHRKFSRLSYKERVIIEQRFCRDRKTMTDIASELGRPTSAVSREIGGKPRVGRGKYNADRAQRCAEERRGNQGRDIQLAYGPLRTYVVEKLKIGWSPEQVSIRLPIDYPRDKYMRISYEAIYQYVYAQIHRHGNGAVKRGCEDLRPYLVRRHTRRQKKGLRKAQKVERDASLPSIDRRPKIVEQRTRVGDWEDDTLVSRASDVRVKSMNERRTGIAFFGKTRDGTAHACDAVVHERLARIPHKYRRTLTRDRGSENRVYEPLEHALDLSVYFAHAYASYERGSNENVNGLLRRYFPKKTDWATVSDEELARVEYLINSRPRKRLKGLTPYESFYQATGVALEP
jgi:IS30 family transposase